MDEWMASNEAELDIDKAYAGIPSEERKVETNVQEALEDANGGLPLNFTNVSNVHTGEMVGPDWWEVFLPCWIAESFVVLVSTLAMYFHLGGSRNTRLLHMNSNAQAVGAALFKVTLMRRLSRWPGESNPLFPLGIES